MGEEHVRRPPYRYLASISIVPRLFAEDLGLIRPN